MLAGHWGWPTRRASQSSSGNCAAGPASSRTPALPRSRSSAAARALGPPKGRRARRRRRRTYHARLAAPPASSPAAAAAASTRAARTHGAPPNSKEPGAGEGAPPGERSVGRGRVRGGELGKCYNFLPCPPPGRGGLGTRRGREARAERQ